MMTGTVDIDMYETDTHVIVKAKAPGYKEDDVKITVEDSILTIEGTMKQETEQNDDRKNRKYHIKEMKETAFTRSLQLPTRVNADKAEATFEDGLIIISLPKMEEAKPKTITIKTTKK